MAAPEIEIIFVSKLKKNLILVLAMNIHNKEIPTETGYGFDFFEHFLKIRFLLR